MRAVLLKGDKDVEIAERPDPTPDAHEVVVAMRASAICRSDMTLYYGDPIVGGEQAGAGIVVPGHEPAGVVVAVGSQVRSLAEGDRVTAHLAFGCGHCRFCHAGERMLCNEWQCLGFDVDGGNAEYFKLPAVNALKLLDEVSFKSGALLTDMVGTQFHAQRRLRVNGSDTVAVFGLGPMGAAAVMVARGHGARVLAVDLLDDRLKLATTLGADATVRADDDPVAAIMELTDGRGCDVAIDCSGAPPGQNAALDAAAKKGRVAFVGESRSTTINPSDQLIRKTLEVIGGWYFPIGEFEEIQRFAVQHKLPVEDLVTHTFDLSEAADAFAKFDARETEKAVFESNR